MTKPAAKKPAKAVAGNFAVRGRGIADLVSCIDFGGNTESFSVDTIVDRRPGPGGNAAAYDNFVSQLKKGGFETDIRTMNSMIAFLDTEVDAFGTPPSDALRAKNMFRAAFGLPFLAAGGPVPPPKKNK